MRIVPVLLWCFMLWPGRLAAQWRLGVELGSEWFSGASGPAPGTSPEAPSFRPYHPTWWGVRVDTPGDGLRFALTLRAGAPDLALIGQEATIVEHLGVTQVLGLVPEGVLPVARLGSGARLLGSAGVMLERWSFEGRGARLRAGPTGGLELAVPLGGRIEAALGGSVGFLPASVFSAEDLPETLEPRSVWRRSLRGSLRVRL